MSHLRLTFLHATPRPAVWWAACLIAGAAVFTVAIRYARTQARVVRRTEYAAPGGAGKVVSDAEPPLAWEPFLTSKEWASLASQVCSRANLPGSTWHGF